MTDTISEEAQEIISDYRALLAKHGPPAEELAVKIMAAVNDRSYAELLIALALTLNQIEVDREAPGEGKVMFDVFYNYIRMQISHKGGH